MNAMSGGDAARRGKREPRPKRLGGLVSWLGIVLALYVFAEFALGAAELWMLRFLQAVVDRRFDSQGEMMRQARTVDLAAAAAGILDLAGLLASAIVYVWFLVRAVSNLAKLKAPHLTGTAAGAVLWHFVPIANLWKPAQNMASIWRNSLDPAGAKAQPPATLWIWWVSWNAANFISIASAMFHRASGVETGNLNDLGAFETSAWLNLVDALAVLAASLGLLHVVRGIAMAQDARLETPGGAAVLEDGAPASVPA